MSSDSERYYEIRSGSFVFPLRFETVDEALSNVEWLELTQWDPVIWEVTVTRSEKVVSVDG